MLTDKEVMKALINQLNKSFREAKENGQENITLYTEAFQKLAQLSGRDVNFEDMNERDLKFATYSTIRSKNKISAAISIANRALTSKWASQRGRDEIYEKAKRTGMNRFVVEDEDVYMQGVKELERRSKEAKETAKKVALEMVDIEENEIYEDYKQEFIPPSDVVFEAFTIIKERNYSTDSFGDMWDYVQKNAISMSDKDSIREAMYYYFDEITGR